MNKKIDLMEGEHIIYNDRGKPVFTNKTFPEQEEHERDVKIPYMPNIEKYYINMMTAKYKQRQ